MAAVDTTANQWATKAIQNQPAATTAPTNVWNVDPAKQTTGGQLDEILKTDNPLMQTAATQAKQSANERGLINSTMAVQAGQQAMINSATPIAQSNAQTMATNAQFNTQQQNAMGQFNSAEANKLLQTSLDLNNRTELANIEANYKNLMQANASAFQTWQQTLKNISDIQQNADMDATTKQSAVTEQTNLLKNSFNMLGAMNNLNLSSLLNFDTSEPPVTNLLAKGTTTEKTNANIKSFVDKNSGSLDTVYEAAKSSGITGKEIDTAMGWAEGTFNNYVSNTYKLPAI